MSAFVCWCVTTHMFLCICVCMRAFRHISRFGARWKCLMGPPPLHSCRSATQFHWPVCKEDQQFEPWVLFTLGGRQLSKTDPLSLFFFFILSNETLFLILSIQVIQPGKMWLQENWAIRCSVKVWIEVWYAVSTSTVSWLHTVHFYGKNKLSRTKTRWNWEPFKKEHKGN